MIDIYVLEDNVNQQFRIEKMIGDLLETNQWETRHFDLFSEPDYLTNLVEESFPQIFSWILIFMEIIPKELKWLRR